MTAALLREWLFIISAGPNGQESIVIESKHRSVRVTLLFLVPLFHSRLPNDRQSIQSKKEGSSCLVTRDYATHELCGVQQGWVRRVGGIDNLVISRSRLPFHSSFIHHQECRVAKWLGMAEMLQAT